MSDWISVEDRLPIIERDICSTPYKNVGVIIATKNFVDFDYFEAGKMPDYWSQFKDYRKEVTHWQPLPAPPEKQE